MSLRTRLSVTTLEDRETPAVIASIDPVVYTPPVTPPAGTVVDTAPPAPAAPPAPTAPPIYTGPTL